MTTDPSTDPDGYKKSLKEAAGIIVGVEEERPNDQALHQAAQPFLDYVAGLDLTS